MSTLKKCTTCGSTRLTQRRVARSFGTNMENLVIVRNVPVVSCRDCGESYIRGQALKRVTAIVQNRAKLRKVEVPVTHV